MKKRKILFICSQADKHLGLFDDLENDSRVILCYYGKRYISNPFLRLIRRIHLSTKINKIVNFPYKHIWTTLPVGFSEFYSILANDGVLKDLEAYLEKCRKKKIPTNLFLADAMDAQSIVMQNARPIILKRNFTHIYTFEFADSIKYGFEYMGFGGYYSKKNLEPNLNNNYDLFFSGGIKGGREIAIQKLYTYLSKSNCNFLFDINGEPFIDGEHIQYHRFWIPYKTVLDYVGKSNCILEIVQQGQTGPTLRYFEAVCYNKKLLTNNPQIVDFPFYNPKWMKIYEKPEDIDIDWIKEEENIDFGYNGEFSPTHMVDYLIEHIKE